MITEAELQSALLAAGATSDETDQMFVDFATWAAQTGGSVGDFNQFGVYLEGTWTDFQQQYPNLGPITLDGITYGGKTVPDFVIGPGFQAEIAKRGWHPASDEVYFSQTANAKLSVVSCDEGLMFYDNTNNKVGVLPFDSAP